MENVQPHAINVPNEDWASISDVEQRRRIQNRVAQRRHRRRMKELKKAPSPSPSPLAPLLAQNLPGDQFNASRSSPSSYHRPVPSPSPHSYTSSSSPADPSPRPIPQNAAAYFPPLLSPDVEMMLRQWYAQSMPPVLGTAHLASPMDVDPLLPMAQMSQVHLGADLQQKMGTNPPSHGMPQPADNGSRPYSQVDNSRGPDLDGSDDSSTDADDPEDNPRRNGGDFYVSGGSRDKSHSHDPPGSTSDSDKAHINRIRRAFRQGLRAGMASPAERASTCEHLQRRLVQAVNKVIELYDYGCCVDVIQPDSDLDRMLLVLQERLGRVREMGK
ncbi:hypothetical protein MPDQ_006455 [Monascus purpureus]|uniref:BZIP domain-containing protein n=1 Tax=Monascus purpureus TaxID=5098 RepID=A0A507QYU7_MONPU|nr:hypothetical protein MPDQ_006455 [Monascus purpureus]BDD56006.1 hypothetical protein MAP00_001486 [Monascus purpureus]